MPFCKARGSGTCLVGVVLAPVSGRPRVLQVTSASRGCGERASPASASRRHGGRALPTASVVSEIRRVACVREWQQLRWLAQLRQPVTCGGPSSHLTSSPLATSAYGWAASASGGVGSLWQRSFFRRRLVWQAHPQRRVWPPYLDPPSPWPALCDVM